MLAEALQVEAALTEWIKATSGPRMVRDILGPYRSVFHQPERSAEEEAVWWGTYMDALDDLPRKFLAAGIRAWVRTDTSGFLPKPGQWRALAVKAAGEFYTVANRLRTVRIEATRKAAPPPALAPLPVIRPRPMPVMERPTFETPCPLYASPKAMAQALRARAAEIGNAETSGQDAGAT